jgi:transposase
MITAATLIGIDVSRDWLDGFCLPCGRRFRLPNSADGHARLAEIIEALPAPSKIGFEATGGQEWALWVRLVAAGLDAVQLPPAQIKAYALSWGRRAKTDRIDAELIVRFMAFRPEAGRRLPSAKLRVLRTLTTRRAQIVEMRKRLLAQIGARTRQGVAADLDTMDGDLRGMLEPRSVSLSSVSLASWLRRAPWLPRPSCFAPFPGSDLFLRPCCLQACQSSAG